MVWVYQHVGAWGKGPGKPGRSTLGEVLSGVGPGASGTQRRDALRSWDKALRRGCWAVEAGISEGTS